MHTDPSFPDCPPGKTVEATGIVTFYEGTEIDQKLTQLARTNFSD